MTQPSANQNQPQVETNGSQQPGAVVGGGQATGQQLSQRSQNQNQSQAGQAQGQQPRSPTTGTGPNR